MPKVLWVLNAVFFAFPSMLLCMLMIAINIVLMIVANRWWAEGNLILLFKTAYLMIQTLVSIPVLFEIDIIIRRTKVFRFFSLMGSIAYVFI